MLYNSIFSQVGKGMHNLSDLCFVGLGMQVEESGWTMSIALVQNQDWPPAQETHLDLTTVSILRMWLFPVTQVITTALDVERHLQATCW